MSDRCPLGYLFLNILKRQLWKFFKLCRHIDIDEMYIYNRKLRARGQFYWLLYPLQNGVLAGYTVFGMFIIPSLSTFKAFAL